MTCHRGDVVLLDYPFSDSTGSKVRPALVVQSDRDNVRLTNTVVALITRNVSRVSREPTQMLIEIATPEGQRSGLRANSAVICTNLFTVNERHLIHTIGHLDESLMRQVDQCLKAALSLC